MKTSDIKNLLNQALSSAASDLNTSWAETAAAHEWDAQSASLVSVKADNNGLDFSYNPDAAQKIFDNEYGYKKSSPKPAMRTLEANSTERINSAIYDVVSKCLEDLI